MSLVQVFQLVAYLRAVARAATTTVRQIAMVPLAKKNHNRDYIVT